jgi:hypothetical protein
LCGFEFSQLNEVTLDHIIPIAFGGSEKSENWQLTCALCNSQKQEYWGVADLSRSTSLRACQDNANFFRMPATEILQNLKLKGNPTRYWVLERDGRKCSGCETAATEGRLYIAPLEKGFLLTLDNLGAFCLDCIKERKVDYCKCP